MLWKKTDRYTLYNCACQEVKFEDEVDCIITSPPYYQMRWLETDNPLEIGGEKNLEEYLDKLSKAFYHLNSNLKTTSNIFINLGDKFHKKQQMLIPEKLALKLEKDIDWKIHQIIQWYKPNAIPNSKHDRLTPMTESILWLVKDNNSFYHNIDPIRVPHKTKADAEKKGKLTSKKESTKYASAEKSESLGSPRARANRTKEVNYYHALGKNPGNVWHISTEKSKGTHFSPMPKELAKRLILLGCPPGGTVLDPFNGSGTTMLMANSLDRKYIGIEVSKSYLEITSQKCSAIQPSLFNY